jgi:hypothetical protein
VDLSYASAYFSISVSFANFKSFSPVNYENVLWLTKDVFLAVFFKTNLFVASLLYLFNKFRQLQFKLVLLLSLSI